MDWLPVWLSLKVALIATGIIIIVAIPIASLMAHKEFKGKDLVETILLLPMVLPPSVVGFAILMLFGQASPLGRLLAGLGLQVVFTWGAAVVASTIVAFPLLYQGAKTAFFQIDRHLEQAARTLGAGELRVFFTISLPLAMPGVLGALVLAFARAMGEFGATMMVMGNLPGQTPTIPVAVYFAVQNGQNAYALYLVLIITVMSMLVIYWSNWWKRKHPANELEK